MDENSITFDLYNYGSFSRPGALSDITDFVWNDLGYMYEYPINDINLVTQQTHELSLRYFWRSKYYKRVKSPRYFL